MMLAQFNLLFTEVLRTPAFHNLVLPFGDALDSIFGASHKSFEDTHSG
jgi:hypothetical protein